MGFAFPAGMGAKFAFPDTRVIAVCGDAGFLMNVQDIETAVRYNLNVVAVILMDGEYGLIKWKQQNQFKGKHSDLKFNNPDFAMLAESFDAWGKVISSAEEFKPALEEAFKKALNNNGKIIFSTFGSETLKEFRHAANMNGPTTLLSLSQWKTIIFFNV